MKYSRAKSIAVFTVSNTRSLLRTAAKFDTLPRTQADYLELARNRLHEACSKFEQGDDVEAFEEFYLPLFDTLSILTQCLHKQTSIRECVTTCLFMLDQIGQRSAKV